MTISCNNSIGFWVEFSAIRIIQSMEADPGKRRQQKKFEPKKKSKVKSKISRAISYKGSSGSQSTSRFNYISQNLYIILLLLFSFFAGPLTGNSLLREQIVSSPLGKKKMKLMTCSNDLSYMETEAGTRKRKR